MIPINKLPSTLQIFTSSIKLITQPTFTSSFHIGEVIDALVMEDLNTNQVLLKVKESILLATSEFPLKVGDKLNLKVEKTQPQLILSTIIPDDENMIIKNQIAMFRSSPDGMLNIFKNGLDLFQNNILKTLPLIEGMEIESIVKLIDSLIYSDKNSDNTLYLKDYIQNIGFLLENKLKKFIEKGEDSWQPTKNNLKTHLTELSTKLHQMIGNVDESDLKSQILQTLKSLSKYTDSSLDTIYNQQVVNVVGQEENQGYFFQIPINFCEDLKMADIFISSDGRNKIDNKSSEEFQCVIFLNMNHLGDIMIDVKYNNKKIIGTFKCDRDYTLDVIQNYLDTLNNRLNLSGYGPNYLNVFLSKDLKREKSDFISNKVIFSKTIVNCFA